MQRWRAAIATAAAALVVAGLAVVAHRGVPDRGGAGLAAGERVRLDPVPPGAPPHAAVAPAGAAPAGVPDDATPIAPPPDTFEAPPAPPEPPPRALTAPGPAPAGGVWAVVIGINDYPGSRNDLRYAVNDANDVDEALARYGVPGPRRLVIRDRQATAGVIAAAADWLVARAGPDAVAVFFYAGHVRRLSSTTQAIIGADGRLLTDAELASHLAGLQARRSWITLASCFGGGFTEVLAPGRVLTGAADADSLAYESGTYARSYLVQFMVRQAMIEGAAPDSVQHAFAYAKREIDARFQGRSPVEFDQAGVPIDLRSPGASPPPPKPAPGGGGATQPPPPASQPATPPPDDGCAGLTLGLVTCR